MYKPPCFTETFWIIIPTTTTPFHKYPPPIYPQQSPLYPQPQPLYYNPVYPVTIPFRNSRFLATETYDNNYINNILSLNNILNNINTNVPKQVLISEIKQLIRDMSIQN